MKFEAIEETTVIPFTNPSATPIMKFESVDETPVMKFKQTDKSSDTAGNDKSGLKKVSTLEESKEDEDDDDW